MALIWADRRLFWAATPCSLWMILVGNTVDDGKRFLIHVLGSRLSPATIAFWLPVRAQREQALRCGRCVIYLTASLRLSCWPLILVLKSRWKQSETGESYGRRADNANLRLRFAACYHCAP